MNISKNIQSVISRAGALSLLLMTFAATEVKAQLSPLGAVYYQNQFLTNPAMAGKDQGIRMNLAYRQQWSVVPGAPVTQSITAEYGSSKKAGIGLSVYNDEAGLMKRTRVMGTYAYHLQLDSEKNKKLSFGVSLGYMDERIMNENIYGDASDRKVNEFNDRDFYMDGDFGVAYSSDKLSIQAAIPNLKSFFKKDNQINGAVDRATFFSAVSYKFYFPNALDGMGLEPKVCFREVQNFKNLVDVGTNITLARSVVNVMAMYHSSNSATIGMGVKCSPSFQVNGIYTSGTAALRNYTNGNFELNLKVDLSKLKL